MVVVEDRPSGQKTGGIMKINTKKESTQKKNDEQKVAEEMFKTSRLWAW